MTGKDEVKKFMREEIAELEPKVESEPLVGKRADTIVLDDLSGDPNNGAKRLKVLTWFQRMTNIVLEEVQNDVDR